jgi:CBS domain-containing protein
MLEVKKLNKYSPFSQIPEEASAEVVNASGVVRYKAGTVIFTQHDAPSGYLYFIGSGRIDIIVETPEGVEMVVDSRSEGGYFGWTPVFTNEGYTAGAKAAEDSVCLLIPQAEVLESARKFPIISNFFNKAIFSQVRKLYKEMVERNSMDPAAQMEAYPFQKRLSEIMSRPVATCSDKSVVRDVAVKMTEEGIAALVVTGENDRMVGIVTERDLVRKVLARDVQNPAEKPVSEVMTANPFYMTPDTYMYEAATFMFRHGIRHLPVLKGDVIEGIVSIQDLMRFRSQKSMLLVGGANEAESVEELAEVNKEIAKVARVLLIENRSHVETMEILSYVHHSIIRRCFEIVKKSMLDDGYVMPDIRWCFLIMGSGGRKEMLLGPDQDNGFLYEDYPAELDEAVDAFFVPFSERLVLALAEVGYHLCNGKVMVNNPAWRGRVSEWRERVSRWIKVPEPQRVRYSSIFFDFMPIAGDSSLCFDLRDTVSRLIKENPLFLFQMMELDYKHKVPLGLLDRFITHKTGEHKGLLSLKENGSIFIVDCVRMYMLEQGIHAVSTIDRLDRLEELKIFNKATADHIKAAFESFTYLRLQNELRCIDKGLAPSHFLDPDGLSEQETELLKEAFKAAGKLQDSARRYFSKIIGR